MWGRLTNLRRIVNPPLYDLPRASNPNPPRSNRRVECNRALPFAAGVANQLQTQDGAGSSPAAPTNFHNKTFDVYGITVHTGIMQG